MGYGIKDDKLYLTNNFEKKPISQMIAALTAGQWMIIPKEHIINRNLEKEDIIELKKERWNRFSVLERVINIKKFRFSSFMGNTCFNDLTIPYGGIAGISAFCKKDNVEGMKFLEKYTTNEEDILLPIYEKSVKANRLNL